jgi:hypothetical protein
VTYRYEETKDNQASQRLKPRQEELLFPLLLLANTAVKPQPPTPFFTGLPKLQRHSRNVARPLICEGLEISSPGQMGWQTRGTIDDICKKMDIPKGSRTDVKKILESVIEAHDVTGNSYTGELYTRKMGRPIVIEPGSVEAQITVDALESGAQFNSGHSLGEPSS